MTQNNPTATLKTNKFNLLENNFNVIPASIVPGKSPRMDNNAEFKNTFPLSRVTFNASVKNVTQVIIQFSAIIIVFLALLEFNISLIQRIWWLHATYDMEGI